MRLRKIKISTIFVLFLFICGCRGNIDTSLFQEGDLIFQNKKNKGQEFLTVISKQEYNNIGILYYKNGKWYVLEAVQPVQLTPISGWIKDGQDEYYIVKRIQDSEIYFTKENIEIMKELSKDFMGKAYDSLYEWSDKSFYPSELVWKIYQRALAIELCGLQTLADFDLADETVKQKIKEVYGSKVPLYEDLVTVGSIYNSSLLVTITENKNVKRIKK